MAGFSQLRQLQIRASNFLGRGHANRLDDDPVPKVGLLVFLPGSIEELWISDFRNKLWGGLCAKWLGWVWVLGRGAGLGG